MIVWLTGRSGAGKTTLGRALAGLGWLHVDGDDLRSGLCIDLGYSKDDREENARRALAVAEMLDRQGVRVIVSMIQPPPKPVKTFCLTGSRKHEPVWCGFEHHYSTPAWAIPIDTTSKTPAESLAEILCYL